MYKVFIVDDEPFIVEGLYDIVDWPLFGLEIVGHAENGRQALEALKTTPADVLITDISMPIMDGLSLISEVRKLHEDMKVIILSGFNEFDYLKEGMRLGIENYLLKPINVEELESTLRNTVQKLDRIQPKEQYDDYDIQILKDNTLYRWLNGQIAEAEFAERAGLLDLKLRAANFGVCVLRTKASLSVLFERVTGFLETRDEQVTLCRDVDGDLVLIASFSGEEDGRKVFIHLVEDLSMELSVMSRQVHIGVGRIEPVSEEASLSYKEAKRALEYYIVYPERLFIEYRQLAPGQALSFSSGHSLSWAEYSKLILSGDTDELKKNIRDDFEQLKQREGVRPDDLQSAAMELVIRFKMELQEIKLIEEAVHFKQALSQIQSSQSFDGLVEILQEVADITVNSLMRDAKSPVVHQVLNYIHGHFAEELSLKTLGAYYHIHPVYLGQLFLKETGGTFAEYINKYRIEKAKELLKMTNHKVHEIARNVGYWETGYFYKQFRKYVGISPTDFKALH